MYWDIKRPLSYGCLFNFIVGSRGVGKTYGTKKWAIDDFIKRKNQFVYVRRYKEELKKISKFFDDIKDSYPNHTFEVKKPNFYIDGELCGTCIPLSTAKIEKSTPFPKVSKIIFDEFILDRGPLRYLPDEVTNFLELYSTIARSRDVTVFFLSNALTITNPYFLYFDISIPYKKEIKAENDILVQMVKDEEFSNMMKQTRFGKIIGSTQYGNYAIDNTFLRDNKNFIEKKSQSARYLFTLIYKNNKYGVWQDNIKNLVYVSVDVDNSCKIIYSVTIDDHSPDRTLIRRNMTLLFKYFIESYKSGMVRFESVGIKNLCHEIIKSTL